MCHNLSNETQVQLDRLDVLVLSKTKMLCTFKSRNDMKDVKTMEIKALFQNLLIN